MLNMKNVFIVHFKHLDSDLFIKKTNYRRTMNIILCKTDPILIWRHIYNSNTLSDVDFEAFSKSVNVPLRYSQFQ